MIRTWSSFTLRVLLAAGFLAFPIVATAAEPATAESRSAPGPSYSLRVDGLACPFCAYGVEKQLVRIEGVQSIDVDIASGSVSVTMVRGETLDETRARTAVENAGFSLRGFERLE